MFLWWVAKLPGWKIREFQLFSIGFSLYFIQRMFLCRQQKYNLVFDIVILIESIYAQDAIYGSNPMSSVSNA